MNTLFQIYQAFSNAASSVRDSIGQMVQKKVEEIFLCWVSFLKVIFMNLFILILSLILTLSGVILLPIFIILFTPWENDAKLIVGVLIGLSYIGVGAYLYFWLFEKSRWVKMFKDHLKHSELERGQK